MGGVGEGSCVLRPTMEPAKGGFSLSCLFLNSHFPPLRVCRSILRSLFCPAFFLLRRTLGNNVQARKRESLASGRLKPVSLESDQVGARCVLATTLLTAVDLRVCVSLVFCVFFFLLCVSCGCVVCLPTREAGVSYTFRHTHYFIFETSCLCWRMFEIKRQQTKCVLCGSTWNSSNR